MKHPHLIFYDDTCAFCRRSVGRISAWDAKEQFQFASLLGNKAQKVLGKDWNRLKNANTLILVENYRTGLPKIWIKGRAVMRIFWLLGGWRKAVGWLAFVPFGVDQVYAFIAKRRHRF